MEDVKEISNKTLGVRLTESEHKELEEVKRQTSVSKAKLAQIAIRRLLREWNKDGKLVL